MIKVEVKNIKWDLDSKDKKEKLNLPTEYTFEIEDKDKSLLDDYDFVPDVLSQDYDTSRTTNPHR